MAHRARTITVPDGPALVFVGPWRADGTRVITTVDQAAVTDRRERHLYRALTAEADHLADQADADAAEPRRPVGFTLTADTERSGD